MPYFIFASHRHSLLRPLSLLPALGLCLGLVLAGAFWCPPAAQAASINIEGGGGGGGGGDDGSGAAARGGGGNGGLINTAAGVTAGTGESDNTSPGGNGGQGGNANANKDGADGGVGGAGLNTLVTNHGVTAGVTQTGEDGGNGGSAAADDTDTAVAAVGGPDTVSILGGSGGNGGDGSGYSGPDPAQGSVGGRGGDGGNAGLNWGTGNHTIGSLNVLAGTNGAAGFGWTDTGTGSSYYSSGGVGGSASFYLDGDLTASGTVNVQARGNSATYTSNNLTAGGATTLTSTNSRADMTVHGNANLTTLTVTSTGSALASFLADTTGIVTTSGVVSVLANSTGNASFNSIQYFGGGATTVGATSSGDASMTMLATQINQVQSAGTLTIESTGSGNARFSAPNALSVRVTDAGQNLLVQTTNSGQASFSAPAATVSVASGTLTVNSASSTSSTGVAGFTAGGLVLTGATTVQSGLAPAGIEVLGNLVSLGNLTVTAGANTADFSANNADLITTKIININGTVGTGGNAGINAPNATISTGGSSGGANVNISTAGASGGTKGIYAASLTTGSDQTLQINNGIVAMTGTGTGDSSAQLVLTDSLQTRQLNLTGTAGNPDALVVNVNNLDVSYIDTAFNFTNTLASADQGVSGVYFKTITLGTLDSITPSEIRTINVTGSDLGSYWADTLKVNLPRDPATSQRWAGNLWLGGTPGDGVNPTTATGTVGALDVILPGGANLAAYIGDGSAANPNYMLAVSGELTLNTGAAVNLRASGGNPFQDLIENQLLQIIYSDNPIIDNTAGGTPVTGISELGAKNYLFNMQLSADQQSLLANYLGEEVVESVAKAYLEGPIAALGTLNLGADLESRVIRNTFDPYANKGMFTDGQNIGIMFGAEYTHLRLDSGSHVDSDNYNVVVGPAFRFDGPVGQLGLGIFFEAGYGDYSSYNSFPGFSADGDGDTRYYGGGIALRNNFNYGIYADLSLRAGYAETDQSIDDRTDAGYDMDGAYYGGHIGLGKIFDFEQNGRLDLGARLLWTHLNGDDVTTDAGEDLSIDDSDSLRSQLGARYTYDFTAMLSGYAGAAWEYEFDGEVSGDLDDHGIDEPSLKGSTGIGELGISVNPTENLSVDLGVQGYVGQREGIGGTLQVNFEF